MMDYLSLIDIHELWGANSYASYPFSDLSSLEHNKYIITPNSQDSPPLFLSIDEVQAPLSVYSHNAVMASDHPQSYGSFVSLRYRPLVKLEVMVNLHGILALNQLVAMNNIDFVS
jgi:hypothetical protein